MGKGSKGEECTVPAQMMVVERNMVEVVEALVRVANELCAVVDLLLLSSS